MTDMMQAMLLTRDGIKVQSVPMPVPGPGKVLIRVANCAICQSDVHWIRNHQATLGPAGQILGHELAGEVVALGPSVADVAIGSRVTARPLSSCGHCAACRRGLPRACPERAAIGLSRPGAFAEYVVASARVTFPIPESVSFAAAALSEPLACAYNAVMASAAAPGDWAVVVGPGPLGLLATRLLKLRGAKVIH
jgi:threonine dehydrogenase-like Zn-dependent dehydrogenase